MKLLCCVWSHEARLFSVEFEPEETVEELKKVIASNKEVNIPASHVTLYHASISAFRLKDTMQFKYTTGRDPSLQKAIYDGCLTEMENAMTVESYKPPDPEEKEVNIVVEIHPHSIGISTHRAGSVGLPVESSTENIGLDGLWQYGALELLKPPSPDRFPVIFRRRLPFRVRVRDQKAAAKLFQEDGPELRCDDLSVLIDAILMTHEAEMGKGASKHSCQRLEDQLLGLTSQICRANGYSLKLQRKDPYDQGGIDSQQRPDITVFCNGCLVLCGLETTDSNNRSLFHEKMERWDPLVFGEMPYTLCYTTDGKHISLYTLSPSNNRGRLHHLTGFSLTGDAIRVFYHLAFIFERMTTWSKVTLPTPLSPFKPYETKKGSIELLKGSIQLTFKRNRCADSLEFKRITDIYKNMKKLNMPSRSGLQTVRNLKCTSLFSPKLVVELSPVGYYRVPANVKEMHSWLRSMLYALTSWHGGGYCHGSVCWHNMVYRSGRWWLINMETSQKSNRLDTDTARPKFPETARPNCQSDLAALGGLIDSLRRKIPLTGKLIWIRDKLLSAHLGPGVATAEKMLDMLERMETCDSDIVSLLSSVLDTPDLTADYVLAMVKDFASVP